MTGEDHTKGPGGPQGVPESSARPFAFLPLNVRPRKPRRQGVTEIRGPYYSPMGRRYLEDLLETMGEYVDGLKFAGGSFALMPRPVLRDLIDLCHAHGVEVSTGGFIERVLLQGKPAVDRYIGECRDLGFDIVELSSGFITLPPDDWLGLVGRVQKSGLKAKPELGIQFGAGGASTPAELESGGTRNVESVVALAHRFVDAGAPMLMIESEGITESVRTWRTEVPARFADAVGLDRVMFEAADPEAFTWYVKHFGPDVNLFVDHSQVVQLECLRAGLWGTTSLWGRVVTYKG